MRVSSMVTIFDTTIFEPGHIQADARINRYGRLKP